MDMRLHFVTGAPGAGKTTTLHAFLALRTGHVAFDIDWLADAASDLADRSIYVESSTWPAYGRIWLEILHGVHRNGRVPVLFTPFDGEDLASHGRPDWFHGANWILLDCTDEVRTSRLATRSWDPDSIAEALTDAATLRQLGYERIDTGQHRPEEVAVRVARWLTAP